MNNLDRIISYLNGESTEEQRRELERKIRQDPDLLAEFEAASRAYELMRSGSRAKDEDQFRSSLAAAMQGRTPRTGRQFLLPVILAIAASLVLSLFFLWPGKQDAVELFASHFHPESDPALEILFQPDRSPGHQGNAYFNSGMYPEAFEAFRKAVASETGRLQDQLGLLLSALYLEREAEVMEMAMEACRNNGKHSESMLWYTSLALIRQERFEEAAACLESLTILEGSYRKVAGKLQKALLK